MSVCLSLRCSATGDSFPQRQHAGGIHGGGRGHAGVMHGDGKGDAGGMQGYGGQQQHAGAMQGAYKGNAGAMQGYGGQQQSQRQPGMLDHLSGIDFNQTLVSSWLSVLYLPHLPELQSHACTSCPTPSPISDNGFLHNLHPYPLSLLAHISSPAPPLTPCAPHLVFYVHPTLLPLPPSTRLHPANLLPCYHMLAAALPPGPPRPSPGLPYITGAACMQDVFVAKRQASTGPRHVAYANSKKRSLPDTVTPPRQSSGMLDQTACILLTIRRVP